MPDVVLGLSGGVDSTASALLLQKAGYTVHALYLNNTGAPYDRAEAAAKALDIDVLAGFVKATQPNMWKRFERQCGSDPYKKFYKCFEDAVMMDGLLSVLRHGFKHRGMEFKVQGLLLQAGVYPE